jgi:2-polyprenyl-3-methyl-5-hydroxy-6-metoxy-1,4-benzoquinol methylase
MPSARSSCPLCGAPAREWFRLERGRIDRCTNAECGLGFLIEQPSDVELDALYEEYYYPEHGGAGVYENSTNSKSRQHIAALDAEFGLAGKRVLDYGCGVGNFLAIAAERGLTVEGVEFDDVARQAATEKGFRVAKTIDGCEPHAFEFVYLNDVIEHLRDPVAELAAIRERMRPGGAIFVVTMNMRGLSARVRGSRWGVVTNPTHLWFYDETSLTATLLAAGFEELRLQRWPVEFENHGHVRRVIQRSLQRWGLDGSLRMLASRPAE